MMHTPGPWEVCFGYEVWTGGEQEALMVAQTMPTGDGKDKANAHLLASSPELLEALINCSETIHILAGHKIAYVICDVPICADAKFAIAKAKGQ